jgi:hypothetical protein
MESGGAARRWPDLLWLVVCGVLSSAWCLSSARELSATFDEPVYLQCGLEHWRTGSYAGLLRLGTMPLPVDVVTLPLYLAERWRGSPFDVTRDFNMLLPWARAGTLVFWWLLLSYALLWGRRLAGAWGGRLAVAWLACEPNFLAHAGLATTDLASTACLLALAYHFHAGRGGGWWRRVALPGAWAGAALLAKATALAFGPIILVGLELSRRLAEPAEGRRLFRLLPRDFWRDAVQIGAIGMALTFLYCGSDWRPEPSFVKWAGKLPEGTGREVMLWIATHLAVFSNAGVALARQVTHNVRGHGTFLMGHWAPRAVWYYFPVLLTIKPALPLLIAPLALLLVAPRRLLNGPCLTVGLLLVFSVVCRVQIGIRFMLPLMALAVVGLSAGLVQAAQSAAPGWRRRLLALAPAAGVAWTAAAAVLVWPHGLCYVNELWGGTTEGHRVVGEANYDWGQGLKELADWQRRHPDAPLDVWYFGADPTLDTLPMRRTDFTGQPIRAPEDVAERVRGRYLAVGTTVFAYYPGWRPEHRAAVEYLRGREPVARTMTFLIYDFTHEPAGTADRR